MFEYEDNREESQAEEVADTSVLLHALVTNHHAENLARARIVEGIADVGEVEYARAERLWKLDGSGDVSIAQYAALTEVAAALRITRRAATTMTDIGIRLDRLPLTALRFCTGMLDLAKVQVITSVLNNACATTIAALEFCVVATAEYMSPGELRKAIWRMWQQHDQIHDTREAAAVRELTVKNETDVTLTRRDDGISTLTAHLTNLQGSQADALIDEMAATVCSDDPRPPKHLRSAALMALMFGETALPCLCGSEDCHFAGIADDMPPRRTPLLQVIVSLELLLGLTSTPPTLADGTPLDPAIVYTLATDARWQSILTELLDLVRADRDAHDAAESSTETRTDGSDHEGDGNTGDEDSGDGTGGDGGGDGDVPRPHGPPTPDARSEPETPSPPASERLGRLKRIIGRGRTRSVPPLPQRPIHSAPAAHGEHGGSSEPLLGALTAAWLAAIAANPALGESVDPLGHGPYGPGGGSDERHGHSPTAQLCPPAGAPTYRPSAALATIVRALYRTCVFPGCSVPSEKCELDHRVPFDKSNPEAGGWTIRENLQPLCKANHQDKTDHIWECTLLPSGILVWTSRNGTMLLTMAGHTGMPPAESDAPTLGDPVVPVVPHVPVPLVWRSHRKKRPRHPFHTADGRIRRREQRVVQSERNFAGGDIEAETWWEVNGGSKNPGPTLEDVAEAIAEDSERDGVGAYAHTCRDEALELRRQHRVHASIVQVREMFDPPPF